jgi:hypothetical protein
MVRVTVLYPSESGKRFAQPATAASTCPSS